MALNSYARVKPYGFLNDACTVVLALAVLCMASTCAESVVVVAGHSSTPSE